MDSCEKHDVVNSKSRQLSPSQSQPGSTKTQGQKFNKNIKDLKKIRSFDEIYDILCRVASETDYDAMNFAVQRGFCDFKNLLGQTMVDFSIGMGNYHLARLIIEFGGNRSIRRSTPKDFEFLKFILKIQHNDNEYLWYASEHGLHEVVKFLLPIPGIDVNAKSKIKSTALIYASQNGHHEVVKILLSIPEIKVNMRGKGNSTALIQASLNGHPEVVKLLLSMPEIDVNAKDKCNSTALILASEFGHHEVVKLLLSAPGIDVNAKDKYNNTALYYASEEDHRNVTKLLYAFPGIKIPRNHNDSLDSMYY